MQQNSKRRGFTLVELLVVIAIIAILASVSVVGYMGFTKKAQVSNDMGVVTQLNTALAGEEATEGKNKTMHDAILDAEEAGYLVEKMTPSAQGHDIVWDQESDRFVLMKDNEVVFADSTTNVDTNKLSTLWKVYDKMPAKTEQTYSVYLKEGADLTQTTAPSGLKRATRAASNKIELVVGLDLGANEVAVEVEYTGESTEKVVIRTNNENTIITINNAAAKVSLHGVSKEVNATATETVEIYSQVIGNVNANAGSIEVKEEAKVSRVKVESTNVVVKAEKEDSIGDISVSDKVVIEGNDGKLDNILQVGGQSKPIEKPKNQVDIDLFAGGVGSENSPFLIENNLQLGNIEKITNTTNVYIKVIKDIEYSLNRTTIAEPETWLTAGSGLRPMICLSKAPAIKTLDIDLNGKTLSLDKVLYNESIKGTPALLSVDRECDVVLHGNGTIDAEAGNNNSYGISVNNIKATLTVIDGTYLGATTAFQVQKGTLNVEGGKISLAATCAALSPSYAKYMINCIDASFKDGTAKINVTGGTFVNFDPSNNPEGTNTTYVANGYKVTSKAHGAEQWYTVVKA